MTPCDNCIENECEINGYVCPLYKKYQESKDQKMNDDLISREGLKDHISELMLVYKGTELDNAILNAIDNAPTVDIQTAVMELYRRYQPRLATNVYEFGVELQELLGRYGGGERRCG